MSILEYSSRCATTTRLTMICRGAHSCFPCTLVSSSSSCIPQAENCCNCSCASACVLSAYSIACKKLLQQSKSAFGAKSLVGVVRPQDYCTQQLVEVIVTAAQGKQQQSSVAYLQNLSDHDPVVPLQFDVSAQPARCTLRCLHSGWSRCQPTTCNIRQR